MAEHNLLGQLGEYIVSRILGQIADVKPGQVADLRLAGTEIEVKTAKPSLYNGSDFGFQFCIRRVGHAELRAPVVILVCVHDAAIGLASPLDFFIIPAAEIGDQHKLVIYYHEDMAKYQGRWSPWYQNWEVLANVS